MWHADEGTLHELIDGSLPPAERERVAQHLERCPACQARLSEAHELVRATASLVEALDVPTAVPLPERIGRRIHRNPAALGWAASILVAVGIGFAVRPFLPAVPTGGGAEPAAATVDGQAREIRRKPVSTPVPPVRRDAATPVTASANLKTAVPPTAHTGLASATPTARTAPTPPTASQSPAPLMLRMRPPAAVALDSAPRDTTHRITLEEAVARLGGSIRLIDGLQPLTVERTSGASVLGADPGREAVVVRYRDPRFGIVELAQQRILAADSTDAEAEVLGGAARRSTVRFAPQPQSAPDPNGSASLSWSDPQGFHLVLTAAIPPESLVALRARVK